MAAREAQPSASASRSRADGRRRAARATAWLESGEVISRNRITSAALVMISARLVPTSRNHPARALFARCGWAVAPTDPMRWWIDVDQLACATPEQDLPYTIVREGFEP